MEICNIRSIRLNPHLVVRNTSIMHTMKRFQTHLPEPMLKRLEEIANERDYSVAEIIRSMLQKQIEEYDRSKKECG